MDDLTHKIIKDSVEAVGKAAQRASANLQGLRFVTERGADGAQSAIALFDELKYAQETLNNIMNDMETTMTDEGALKWYRVAVAVDKGFTEVEEFVWACGESNYYRRLEEVAVDAGRRTHTPIKSIISEIEDYYGQASVLPKWMDPENG